MTVSAILTCAGNGCRFGHNKLMAKIDKKPLFVRTIEQFMQVKEIDEIIVAIRKDEKTRYKKILKKNDLKVKLVEGGVERHISAYNGVKISQGEYVLIHDGARPLISPALIRKVIMEVKQHKAVMLATATQTCIKHVEETCLRYFKQLCNKYNHQKCKSECKQYQPYNYVEKCLPRNKSWLGQTPQAFKREIILKAYEKALENKQFVGMDDCDFVSQLGIKVKIIAGELSNLKVTVPLDLIIVRKLYKLNMGRKHV